MTPLGALIIGGWLMMIPLPRRQMLVVVMPGNELREAYIAPTQERVPDEMMRLTRSIAGPLRLVGGKDQ